MFVALGQVELFFPESGSLKEKRFVLKSLKTKIRNKFNVAIAEIDHLDKWQRSTFGFSTVSNNKKLAENIINKVINLIEKDYRVEVIDFSIEIL